MTKTKLTLKYTSNFKINYNGLYKYLGLSTNKEEAIKVRKEAEIKYFGDFRSKL